jgi:hypothetical protein
MRQHGSVPGLMRELAAARLEIARLKERARGWRARFVSELQRNDPASDQVKLSSQTEVGAPAQARSDP